MAITKLIADSITSGAIASTPAFFAYKGVGNQSLTNATYTKIQMDTEGFDIGSCYDNVTNYRFTPNVAGKYFVYASVGIDYSGLALSTARLFFIKNGSLYNGAKNIYTGNEIDRSHITLTASINMNGSTDYLEVQAYGDGTSSTGAVRGVGGAVDIESSWGAYKIIE